MCPYTRLQFAPDRDASLKSILLVVETTPTEFIVEVLSLDSLVIFKDGDPKKLQ